MPHGRSHIVVFEPDPRGHAREWVEHLLTQAGRHQPAIRLTLVVAEELAEALRPELPDHATLDPLTARELRLCMHPRLAVSGFARWRALRRHMAPTDATHGLFLGLDHLALPLGLGLPTAGRPVSGILFRPTEHYRAIGSPPDSLAERLRDLRKAVLTRLMARNPNVRTIFSLDPCFPAYARERYRDGRKIVAVVDPAFPAPEPDADAMAIAADLPSDRAVFVLFGEITERKGILVLLDALFRLPGRVAGSAAVVVAGRIDPPIREGVMRAAAAVRAAQPGLHLSFVDRRLSAGEIAALVRRSDGVLAPYQRFVGSSGVLLWAARMQRPVICQAYGLVGHLTRSFALGATVDSSDPTALADAIAAAVDGSSTARGDPERMSAFIASRSPEIFAETLFAGVGATAERSTSPAAELPRGGAPAVPEWSQHSPV